MKNQNNLDRLNRKTSKGKWSNKIAVNNNANSSNNMKIQQRLQSMLLNFKNVENKLKDPMILVTTNLVQF